MPAALSFNRVGNARAHQTKRAARWARRETNANHTLHKFPASQPPNRLTAWATPRAHRTKNARPDVHAAKPTRTIRCTSPHHASGPIV
ncbi:hypothetical protein K227x_18320 [Rubripirellula lacrimiformis]|uniref:Uncharacterized protein n=1 Tax=Rubripirellula lacrimiformis TaxID=1930273 RepID=A0A517N8X1_9BACT|nr:hypothetical protein K227x_18320 [Rubripirellula lacrimiformis]